LCDAPGLEQLLGLGRHALRCDAIVGGLDRDGFFFDHLGDGAKLLGCDVVAWHQAGRGDEFALGVAPLLAIQRDEAAHVEERHALARGQALERQVGQERLDPRDVLSLPERDGKVDPRKRIVRFVRDPLAIQADVFGNAKQRQDLDGLFFGPLAVFNR
jgi:hypothetical protein